MRYRLFPDHASEAANNLKNMLARSAAGSFAKALEKQIVYISEDAAFEHTGIFRDGFSKNRNIWHAAYVCESVDTGVTSAEHVVKFALKRMDDLAGTLISWGGVTAVLRLW